MATVSLARPWRASRSASTLTTHPQPYPCATCPTTGRSTSIPASARSCSASSRRHLHGGIIRVRREERAKRLDGLVDVPLPRQLVGTAARGMPTAPPGRELPEPRHLAVACHQVREVPDLAGRNRSSRRQCASAGTPSPRQRALAFPASWRARRRHSRNLRPPRRPRGRAGARAPHRHGRSRRSGQPAPRPGTRRRPATRAARAPQQRGLRRPAAPPGALPPTRPLPRPAGKAG